MNFEKEWLASAPKHELEIKITEINKALRERYPHPGKAKYGKLCRFLNDDQLKIFFDSIPPNWVRERSFSSTLASIDAKRVAMSLRSLLVIVLE